ncbi:NAD(P)/FAD-dependent oxidoreductase [Elongatibacter sediminis]|uniref:FAD-dependent oxidoreductase n=1 Tax=Elongatibacter sediminis TaxID=3119006 RepID=A0AAW9R9D8_9GAMM
MSREKPRCIVIGAGIVGASCAWHLTRRGADVTVVDPEQPGQATSYGNAGCLSTSSIFPFSYPGVIRQVPGWLLDPLGPMRIRWQHFPQLLPWFWRFWRAGTRQRVNAVAAAQHRLMATVLEDYDQILQATGAGGLRESRGMILLYGSEAEYEGDRWHYDLRDRFGLAWQRLSAGELAEREPAIRLGQGVAVFDPAWQHLTSPADVTRTIAEAAFAGGAHWVNEKVRRVTDDGDGVTAILSDGRRLGGDRLVLAAGPWSNTLLGPLGARVPLTPKRGYHSMLLRPSVQLHQPVMQFSEYVMMTPMRDGLRVAGTAEFARLDAAPDYRRAKALLQHAQRFLPGLEGEAVTEWMGQRPMMPDSLPVIGPLPGHPRVLCALGHGHYGLTQGPTTGRIIADLAFGDAPHLDIEPYSAARFSGARG